MAWYNLHISELAEVCKSSLHFKKLSTLAYAMLASSKKQFKQIEHTIIEINK